MKPRNRMEKRWVPLFGRLLVGGVLPLVVLDWGCMEPLEKIPGVIENVDQKDIPVPRGFVRRNRTSWSYNEFARGQGSFRSWVTEYVGDKQVRDLVSWYMDEMPKDGWTHKGTVEDTKRVLTFAKGYEELATITLYSDYNPGEDRFQSIIRAEIRPYPPEDMEPGEVLSKTESPSGPVPAISTAGGTAGSDTNPDSNIGK